MIGYNSIKQYTHSFGDFIFYKSMNFRSSYLENLAKERNEALNTEAKTKATEYFVEVMILQYNTLLFNCEKKFMELINFPLYKEFIVPLFDGKTFDQYLIILIGSIPRQCHFQENLGKFSCAEAKTVKNRTKCYDAKRKQSRKKVI